MSPMLSRRVCAAILSTCLSFASAAVVAAPAAPPVIEIKTFMFMSAALTVAPGTSVTWKNLDAEPHTVVSVDGTFRSGALDQGDTFSFTFTKPGTYKYVCSIHPQMVATIIVSAPRA